MSSATASLDSGVPVVEGHTTIARQKPLMDMRQILRECPIFCV